MSAGRAVNDVGVVRTQTLTCEQCGCDWQRPVVRGQRPRRCPSCKSVPKPLSGGGNRMDTNTAGYRLAAAVTSYRLAIEEAMSALLIGKHAEALAALRRVQAPARLPRRSRVIDLTEAAS